MTPTLTAGSGLRISRTIDDQQQRSDANQPLPLELPCKKKASSMKMAKLKKRKPSSRNPAFRKKDNTTLLPGSILRELEACEASTSGYGNGTLGAVSDESPFPGRPQQRVSRKNMRKKLRLQRRQHKCEHQRLRKSWRTQSNIDTETLVQKKKRITKYSNRLLESRTRVEKDAAGSEDGSEASITPTAVSESCAVSSDSVSIGAAAAVLKRQQQQQQRGLDNLQEELRLLERRLCTSREGGAKDSEETRARKRQKLKEELNADGFDFELQGVLDDILVVDIVGYVLHILSSQGTRESPFEACCAESEESSGHSPTSLCAAVGEILEGVSNEYKGCIGAFDSRDAKQRKTADAKSIGSAASRLKMQQQQSGSDRLQDELRLLEKRLLAHRGDKQGAEVSDDLRRKKLREELEKDGFDSELQDILDDILDPKQRQIAAIVMSEEEIGSDEVSEQSSTGDDAFPEQALSDSGDDATQSERRMPRKNSKKEDAKGKEPQPKTYVAPQRRLQEPDADKTAEGPLNLNAVKVEVLQCQKQSPSQAAERLRAYAVSVRQLLCEQLMQSCIRSRFSTNSLIATQTALCCALSKLWDIELCRDFLGALAVCFSVHFAKALEERKQQPEAVAADTASLVARHAVVGLCCLYDFGFMSSRLFVELIRRVAGLPEGSKPAAGLLSELCDYRVELLLLLLRLGGGKLRQEDAALSTSTWKQLQSLGQQHHESGRPRAVAGASQVTEGVPAEAGKLLRALVLELQDLKAGKQKDRLMLVKASQDAMRRWLSSSAVFGPTLLTAQFQIDGSWDALEKGQELGLPAAAAAAAGLQQHRWSQAMSVGAAPDATAVGALAISIQNKAALLRFNTELQQAVFECLVMANGPDDALRALQNSGYLTIKKNVVTQIVAVVMQCCLQEKVYNEFYGLVLSRLCGICGCGAPSLANEAACNCMLLPEKAAARYRRTIQRGLAAQASAAHGFSLRRLLNLAKLTAVLIRLQITDLRIVRFLNFESSVGDHSSVGLTGKLGIFLREVCIELLSSPASVAAPRVDLCKREEAFVESFTCLSSMNDICEVFIALLHDVVLPDAEEHADIHIAESDQRGNTSRILKASAVKAAINTLLKHQQADS
ncbi:hypothetical protein Efla_007156 [Eimeria flavescens]